MRTDWIYRPTPGAHQRQREGGFPSHPNASPETSRDAGGEGWSPFCTKSAQSDSLSAEQLAQRGHRAAEARSGMSGPAGPEVGMAEFNLSIKKLGELSRQRMKKPHR